MHMIRVVYLICCVTRHCVSCELAAYSLKRAHVPGGTPSHVFNRPELRSQSVFALDPVSLSWAMYAVSDPFQSLGPIEFFCAKNRWTPARVVRISRHPQLGFGFSIRGDSPVFVVSLDKEGSADQAGLRVGDVIVRVGCPGTDVRWSGHNEIVEYVCGRHQIDLWVVTQLETESAQIETTDYETTWSGMTRKFSTHNPHTLENETETRSERCVLADDTQEKNCSKSKKSQKLRKKNEKKKSVSDGCETPHKLHHTLFWKSTSSSQNKSSDKHSPNHAKDQQYGKSHKLRLDSFGTKNHFHAHHKTSTHQHHHQHHHHNQQQEQHDDEVMSGYSCQWNLSPSKTLSHHRRVASSSLDAKGRHFVELSREQKPLTTRNTHDVRTETTAEDTGCGVAAKWSSTNKSNHSLAAPAVVERNESSTLKPSWKTRLSGTWRSKSKTRQKVARRDSIPSSLPMGVWILPKSDNDRLGSMSQSQSEHAFINFSKLANNQHKI